MKSQAIRAWLAAVVWSFATILAAPAAQAHEFVVYFEHDSAEIRPHFRDVIVDSACWGRLPEMIEVRVSAGADRSGAPAYNQALSERRARAVADALIAEGVEPARVTTRSYGEAHPSVIMDDGVREPLNRLAIINHRSSPSPPGPVACGPRRDLRR